MHILSLLTATLLVSLIWFDELELQNWVKGKLGYRPHEFVKPWDCFTCTNYHFGWIIAIIYATTYFIISGWYWDTAWQIIIFVPLNLIIGNIIDHIKYGS